MHYLPPLERVNYISLGPTTPLGPLFQHTTSELITHPRVKGHIPAMTQNVVGFEELIVRDTELQNRASRSMKLITKNDTAKIEQQTLN